MVLVEPQFGRGGGDFGVPAPPLSPAPAFFHFPPFYHLSPKLAARFEMLPHFAEGEVPVGVCPPEGGAGHPSV
jgi:hypothetical protein